MQTDKKKMSTSVFESITRCRTFRRKKTSTSNVEIVPSHKALF